MLPPSNNPAPTTGASAPLTKSDILAELNVEEPTPQPVKEDDLEIKEPDTEEFERIIEPETEKETDDEESEKESDKEVDELAEIEEELKDPDPEDLELTTPVKKREILAKYPNIFKEFPSLEKAYYRELAYTRLLPTIDDAKEAVEAVNILNNFEVDLKQGKTANLFKVMAKNDPNAFAKIADTYMENLAQADEKAYHHVLGNITKDIVETMVRVGRSKENKDLQDAATVLYQFMFGDVDWKPKAKLSIDDSSEPTSEKAKLAREREEFEYSKFNERQTDLMSGVNNRIKSVIDSNIDKKEQMTPFIKKNAIKEVQEKLDSLIKADTRFQTIVKKLWENAYRSKYSREAMDKIESAHVSKAKALLPTVIVAVKKEALKGSSTSRKQTNDNDETNRTRNSTASRSKVDSNVRKPNPNESTLEFLMRD